MKIVTSGMSRIVFIYKDTVIKFPWINFLKMIRCFLKYKKQGIFDQKAKNFHRNKILAVFVYFFTIITANRREYLYYKKYSKEETLLPVTKAFLFGFVIVQPRGEVLNGKEQRWKALSKKLKGIDDTNFDLQDPGNFCVFGGRVRLLDYANPSTQKVLNSAGFGIIAE